MKNQDLFSDQVVALAFERKDAELFSLFKEKRFTLSTSWSQEVFLSLLRGCIAQQVLTPVSRQKKALGSKIIEEAFKQHGRSGGKPFFQMLDVWTAFLQSQGRSEEAVPVLEYAFEAGVFRFLSLHNTFVLRLYECLLATGKEEKAFDLVREYACKPYLILHPEVRKRLTELALASFSSKKQEQKAISEFLWLYGGEKLVFFSRGIFPVLRASGRSLRVKIVSLLEALVSRGTRLPYGRVWSAPLRLGLWGVRCLHRLYTRDHLEELPPELGISSTQPGAERSKLPILVTRGMGGLGDIIMMTPGLAALQQKFQDREIHFAIPKSYHELFVGNHDVKLLDIATVSLNKSQYARWYDLTDCPAGKVESLTAPNVKKTRIEIFASAMGIGEKELFRCGVVPRYTVTPVEQAWAEAFLQSLDATVFIGVQPFSADIYRDYPHMVALVRELRSYGHVLVFHSAPLPDFEMPGVTSVTQCSLRQSAALLARCRTLISPDSGLFHLAAALGVPSVVLSGPVSGYIRTCLYPDARYIDVKKVLPCIPCWRNEDGVCRLSGRRKSLCMDAIEVSAILNCLGWSQNYE